MLEVTTLAATKDALPKLNESLRDRIVANDKGGTERWLEDLANTPLVKTSQYDYEKTIDGKPGEPLLRLPFEKT